MAILGCFIRREITAYGSSKQVSRQLNRLFSGSLPYSAALLQSACLAREWICVRLDVLGLEKQEILMGGISIHASCTGPRSVQTAPPRALCPVSAAFSLAAALPVLTEQAALPPPACSKLGLEVLLTRGGEVGALCHQHPRSLARTQDWCTHKPTPGWAQQTQPIFGTKKINPGPHNISVAATNEFHGLELK